MNSSKGFIKVPREVFTLPFWDDPWDTTLWFYCALRVTYHQYGNIHPGQFISSKSRMAEDLHWSRNGLKKHLDSLQSSGCIDVVTTGEGVRITLNYWQCMCDIAVSPAPDTRTLPCDQYWSLRDERDGRYESMDDHGMIVAADLVGTDGHGVTSVAQEMVSQRYSDDHIQEQKEEKKKRLPLSCGGDLKDRERDFQIFWKAYPRHENEAGAKEAFAAANVPLDTLMAALENAKNSRQWLSSFGRFIPNAAKWLDGAWRDYEPKESVEHKERKKWTTY